MNSLDSILSGGGEAVSEQQTTETEQVTQTATEGEGQTGQETEGQAAEGEGDGGHKAPIAALQAERAKVKRYTEEVADFRKSNEALQRQVGELLQRVPVPKVEQPAAPDFFENPQAATQHEVRQTVSPEFDRVNQQLLAFAKDTAIGRFSEAEVNDAEQAFIAAMQNRTLDQSEYQRVVSSHNRYAAAVQWHKRQTAQAEIGDDPAAFKAKVEAELREKILAEINGGNGQQAQQRSAPVTPSNLAGARNVGARSGPAWSGPASLQDIFNRARASE